MINLIHPNPDPPKSLPRLSIKALPPFLGGSCWVAPLGKPVIFFLTGSKLYADCTGPEPSSVRLQGGDELFPGGCLGRSLTLQHPSTLTE